MTESTTPIAGRNGVTVPRATQLSQNQRTGYRSYEVYQRERVGESTEKIKPNALVSEDFREDPYPTLTVLRENYPCYRNWMTNAYWITRYDEVTSVFADDANFETRSNAWHSNLAAFGRNLGNEIEVLNLETQFTDAHTADIAARLIAAMGQNQRTDVARDFAAQLPLELLADMMQIPAADRETFFARYWRAHRTTGWQPTLQADGHRAIAELTDYFKELLPSRQNEPPEDLLSVLANLDLEDGPVTAEDVVATLLERDHQSLQGSLANLWYLLLTHPEEFDKAKSDKRMLKLAYLEALRHSTPILSAPRFTRHEVERFGKLLPEGALVVCCAAAANRDPRIFNNPDQFIVDRKDLCQREPRGQYRADGLASGIAFGFGKPSIYPAVPEDRPRSRYALNRDTVVTASTILLEKYPNITLAKATNPHLTALTVGEMHTCWQLLVEANQ